MVSHSLNMSPKDGPVGWDDQVYYTGIAAKWIHSQWYKGPSTWCKKELAKTVQCWDHLQQESILIDVVTRVISLLPI